jgi:hypothetical protein
LSKDKDIVNTGLMRSCMALLPIAGNPSVLAVRADALATGGPIGYRYPNA